MFSFHEIHRYVIYIVIYFSGEYLRQGERELPIPELRARRPLVAQALSANPQAWALHVRVGGGTGVCVGVLCGKVESVRIQGRKLGF